MYTKLIHITFHVIHSRDSSTISYNIGHWLSAVWGISIRFTDIVDTPGKSYLNKFYRKVRLDFTFSFQLNVLGKWKDNIFKKKTVLFFFVQLS
jgi:hypothetical protein